MYSGKNWTTFFNRFKNFIAISTRQESDSENPEIAMPLILLHSLSLWSPCIQYRYSMVLIGAAFFHRRYLQLFQDQPQAVHALVDETQNCDDIAMNFAVALYLRKRSKLSKMNKPSGVFVKPVDLRNLEKEATSGYQGMWHRPEHLLQRSYCLNKLTQIYGFMPLSFSNLMVSQFGFPSYANHKSRGWRSTALLTSLD